MVVKMWIYLETNINSKINSITFIYGVIELFFFYKDIDKLDFSVDSRIWQPFDRCI